MELIRINCKESLFRIVVRTPTPIFHGFVVKQWKLEEKIKLTQFERLNLFFLNVLKNFTSGIEIWHSHLIHFGKCIIDFEIILQWGQNSFTIFQSKLGGFNISGPRVDPVAEQIWIVRIGLILEIRNNKCNQIGRYERGLGEACGGGAILRAAFEFNISISKYKLFKMDKYSLFNSGLGHIRYGIKAGTMINTNCEFCFQSRFIVAWESVSSICWFKLCCCQPTNESNNRISFVYFCF